jgi:putative serine protease PepD
VGSGNSGGALVDASGQLGRDELGDRVNEQSDANQSGSIGLGFAIPVDQAKRVVDPLVTTGKASHGSLGVQVGSDPSIRASKSSASQRRSGRGGGLSVGSVVTKVDHQVIDDADALVRRCKPRRRRHHNPELSRLLGRRPD